MKSLIFRSNCPDCGKQYTNKFNMKRHYALAHLHENNYVCRICGKSLSSKQNYREHSYIHTGEKPFECEECGARYRQCSQLSVHKRIHRAIRVMQRKDFTVLKVKHRQLTAILGPKALKEFDYEKKPVPELFTPCALPPLDRPNPQATLNTFIFAD